MENKMMITVETGEKKEANVFDIIDSFVFKKRFMIYNYTEEPERLYASIVNETENELSLDPITDPEEIEYVNAEIDRVASELQNTL